MHHVEYESDNITLLTAGEILNPFAVLEEVFQEWSSPVHLQDELFELFALAVRKNYWLTYDSPLIVYRKYKKLMRLFEAGWLIEKIRPDHALSEKLIIPYNQIETDTSTKGRKESVTGIDHISQAYKIVINVYSGMPLQALRSDLFNLLFEGLMPTCVKYAVEFDAYVVESLKQMDSLIQALHIIDQHEQINTLSPKDIEILTKEKNEFNARQTLYDYHHDIYHLYEYSAKEDLTKALKIARGVVYKDGFWKLHGNPANMLYYFHDFLFVLESYWVCNQEIMAQETDINTKWKYPDDKKTAIYRIIRKRIKKPWKYLRRQFEKKTLSEWRNMLECCLEDVLSNQAVKVGKWSQYDEVLDFVAVLLVFNDILKYEPEI